MKDILVKFIKFAGVGGVATGIQYVLIVLFVELFSMVPLYASVSGYIISSLFNYWANYHFTFASQLPHARVLPRFALVSGCGLIINAVVFNAVFESLGVYYLVAQVVATICVLIWNFTVNHLWSFSEKSDSGKIRE